MSLWELGRHLADECYDAVDRVRAENGRWSLTRTPDMAWNAGQHAGWVAHNGRAVHSPESLRPDQSEVIWTGLGISPIGMAQAAVRDWLRHQPHADIILAEDIGRIGVGVYVREILERQRHFMVLVARTGRS